MDSVELLCITQFFDNSTASYDATSTTPRLRKIIDTVGSHENVIAWLNNRPKTVF